MPQRMGVDMSRRVFLADGKNKPKHAALHQERDQPDDSESFARKKSRAHLVEYGVRPVCFLAVFFGYQCVTTNFFTTGF